MTRGTRYDPAALLAACPAPLLVLDKNDRICSASAAAEMLWPGRELIGARLDMLMSIQSGERRDRLDVDIDTSSGLRRFEALVVPIGGVDDRLMLLYDVTERERALVRINHLALTDPLTGLANRRAFDRALQDEHRRMIRAGLPLSMLAIDINGLKRRNDTLGHAAGDAWLRTLGAALAGVARRPGDLPARLGGDEFAVLLPETDQHGAAVVAARIHGSLGTSSDIDAADLTVCIGSATLFPDQNGTAGPGWLVEEADAKLYRAKSSEVGSSR